MHHHEHVLAGQRLVLRVGRALHALHQVDHQVVAEPVPAPGHALDPPLVLGRHRLPERGAHLVDERAVVLRARQVAREVEVGPQLHAQLARHAPLAHELVEVVHGLVVQDGVLVHGGHDARGVADHVRPHRAAQEHDQHAHPVLGRGRGRDVPVADRGDGHDAEVQARAVQREVPAAARLPLVQVAVAVPVAVHQDPRAPLLEPGCHGPRACQPVPHADHEQAELVQRQDRVRDGDAVLPPPEDLGGLDDAHHLQQPQQLHHPEDLELLDGVVPAQQQRQQVEGQDREQVHEEPALQVPPPDLGPVLHPPPGKL
mmetsp:Transcript_4204/g.6697  ORF Transcript_4204/g.6697 Transcript_4204/m.6697 type:complete len:314 (+) Transcript_4204:73-1014(+)